MAAKKTCKDCKADGLPLTRPAPKPGPRCVTHDRAVRNARRTVARERYVAKTYSISEAEYQRIYELQGRACYICRRAKGTGRKRLSVDHDHACCDGPTSCGKCVRGLLCKPCNRDVLGHLRDDAEALLRAAEYLKNPPARRTA